MNRKNWAISLGVVGAGMLMFGYTFHIFISVAGWSLMIFGVLLFRRVEFNDGVLRFMTFILVSFLGVGSFSLIIAFWNIPAGSIPFNILGILIGIFSYIVYVWLVAECFYEICRFLVLLYMAAKRQKKSKLPTSRYPIDLE